MKQGTQLMIIMLFSLISKFSGFIRQFLLARVFGISSEMDSFIIATVAIAFFVGILTTGITNTFVPIYNEINELDNKKKFFKSIFLIITLISIIIMIILFLSSEKIILLVIKNNYVEIELIVKIFKILVMSIIFSLLSEVYAAYFQAIQNFTKLTYINFFMNLIVIVYLLFFYKFGIIGYSIAYLLMEAMRFLLLVGAYYYINIGNTKLNTSKILIIDIEGIKKFTFLILPVIFSSGVIQLNLLVDKLFASRLREGTISTLEYTNKLIQLVVSIFILNYLMWLYPKLVLGSQERIKKIKKMIEVSLYIILLITIPVFFIFNYFGINIIYIIFGREINQKDLLEIEYILKIYSPLVIIISLRELLLKIIFAIKKNYLLVKVNVSMLVINIILNLLLIDKFKILGLGIATIVSSSIGVIYTYIIVRKEIKIKFNYKNILIIISLNTLLFSLLKILEKYIILNNDIKFFIMIFLSGIFYLIIVYKLKVFKDIIELKNIINREDI